MCLGYPIGRSDGDGSGTAVRIELYPEDKIGYPEFDGDSGIYDSD